jgi:quercetin dioxygenase-like cupin family protein
MKPADRVRSSSTFASDVPWVPLDGGLSFKPLRFLPGNRGRVLLLRVEPGTVIPRHRHTGEVHGFNLEGHRQLDTGDIVGPGDYVYEPSGNVDSWQAVGATAVTVLISVQGAVETLDADNRVIHRDDTASMLQTYHQYCELTGLEPVDLSN